MADNSDETLAIHRKAVARVKELLEQAGPGGIEREEIFRSLREDGLLEGLGRSRGVIFKNAGARKIPNTKPVRLVLKKTITPKRGTPNDRAEEFETHTYYLGEGSVTIESPRVKATTYGVVSVTIVSRL